MPKQTIPTKNTAALALARLSVTKRMQTLTAAQRSAQGRLTVASRRDRQPKGPWFGLVVLPADFKWTGTRRASAVLDEAHANTAEVLFWSSDRAEVVARSQKDDLRGRMTLILEQDWDPSRFTIRREFKPDVTAQVKALRSLVDDEGGKP